MNDNVTDLDALLPQPRFIKFEDKEIEIKPPKTADLLRLGAVGKKLGELEKLSGDELEAAVNELTEQVIVFVPELSGKNLVPAQLFKLVSIISDMAVPPDAKELNARGIKMGESDGDPKAPEPS